MANFCPRCGSGINPTDAFCGACGTPLIGDSDYNGSANPYDAGVPVADEAYYVDGETTVGPGFWGAFGYCMKNYCNFRGRATRTEYWGWIVVNTLICVALKFIVIGAASGSGAGNALAELVDSLWDLAVMLPALAVMGRRLHDVGWSAKLMLGPIVLGIVGVILLIVGAGPDVLAAEAPAVEETSLGGALIVGLLLVVSAAIWQLVLGITAGFIRGTNGANRFGGKRLNPSDL